MADTCPYIFVQIHRMYNGGFKMIMMCPYRFISYICPTLVGVLIMGEAVPVCGRGTWEISVPSTHFCYECKAAVKNNIFF